MGNEIGQSPDGMERDAAPQWFTEKPAGSCEDCGRENLFKCWVCGLYDDGKQKDRKLCNSCRNERNRELERSVETDTERSEEGQS